MIRKRITGIVLVAGLLAGIAWQRNTVTRLQKQNETLRPAQEEAVRLELENAELPKLRAMVAEQPQSVGVSPELLRLRNEVRQLRLQRSESDRLKMENERIATEIRSGIASQQKLSEMEGYLAKESWSNAGFDTPEAALQTYFWAMREGNIARFVECLPKKDRKYMAALTEPGQEQEREQMLSDFRLMTQGAGFRVVEKVIQEEGFLTKGNPPTGSEPRVPTKVLMRIQAVAGGAVVPVSFRLDEDGWKVRG
jgi:hypothetical protein